MKVGIVTIVDFNNYGNRLQNYALSHYIQTKYNCGVTTLSGYKSRDERYKSFLSFKKEKLFGLLSKMPCLSRILLKSNWVRRGRFYLWSKKYINFKFYQCSSLPRKLNEKYSFFLAGSDQIWNYRFPKNRINDNFLTFADEQKRIAVSASFGVDTIPPEMQQRYIEGLSGFSHLSVREKAGADIIYDLLRVKVPVLIDPVMLLSKEDWLKVAGNPKRKYAGQYILKYYLGNDDNTIHKWAKDNDYVVYDLLDETIPDLYQADPGEFISLIDKATLICSDSFHCIVMAIIFSKPFIVFRRKGQENYMFSRLETLLEKFGFQNRVADLIKEDEYLKCDFNHVERILTEERQKFKNYISVAMEIEGRKES